MTNTQPGNEIDTAKDTAKPDQPGQSASKEVNLDKVLRSELIVMPGLTGISIPILFEKDGKLNGSFEHYLNIGGTRSRQPVGTTLTLPTGEAYWMSPDLAAPTAELAKRYCGWSNESRLSWLAGETAPSTAEVLRMLLEIFNRCISFDPELAGEHGLTLAAWCMMTYIYPALPALPYVYLSGPPNSGKTRTMEVISRLCFRPLMTGSVTAPYIFRSRHQFGGTLLFDEAERLKDAKASEMMEVNSVLLSGYRRGASADRLEKQKDKFVPQSFDCYGPTVLGCIASLTPALHSRCIHVRMMRAAPDSPQAAHKLDDEMVAFSEARNALHLWALTHGYDAATHSLPPNSLANRAAELWTPLLRIVGHAGDAAGLKLLTDHAERATRASQRESLPPFDRLYIAALYKLRRDGKKPTATEILKAAEAMDEDLAGQDKTAKAVGGALRSYFDGPSSSNGSVRWSTSPKKIEELCERYGYHLSDEGQ